MINTEPSDNGVGMGGAVTLSHDKQPAATLKKTALRDVQNENTGSMQKHQESLLPAGGKPSRDANKVSGNKRLTPERPSSSQAPPSLAHNGTNENVMNARRRFELELGRRKLQKNVEIYTDALQSKNKNGQLPQEIPQKPVQTRDNLLHHIPVATSNNMTPIMALSTTGPSIPNSFGENNNSLHAAKASPELARMGDTKSTNDQLRTDRFIHLQKFLKQREDASQREYMQKLLHLSSSELSKHAVELEKRAIQLTVDEGNEMQRMKTLNILGKPSSTNNLLQPT